MSGGSASSQFVTARVCLHARSEAISSRRAQHLGDDGTCDAHHPPPHPAMTRIGSLEGIGMPHRPMFAMLAMLVLGTLCAGATRREPSVASHGAQAADNAALTRGRASFDRVCGRCHPHGEANVGHRLIGLHATEDRVRTQVRRGRGTMRAISTTRLSDDALADVIVYLRSIGTIR